VAINKHSLPYSRGRWHTIGTSVFCEKNTVRKRYAVKVCDVGLELDPREVVANSQLMVASPGLVESLVELTQWMRANTGPSDSSHAALLRAVNVLLELGVPLDG